jgi:ABC-2 type transport system ATP-binding protein
MMSIVETQGLHRYFKTLPALKDLSLRIAPRELFGLIGPDGAGKTTLMRILAAVLKPSTGSVQVCDIDVIKNPESIKNSIGVVPQNFSLYTDLTVEENMSFYGRMYTIPQEQYRDRKRRLLQITRLEPFVTRRAGRLYGGMQKKLMLICALLHTPQLLLLDEPTTGIDPVSRRELWDFLHELYSQGMTIILSTPYMDEAERCSRIGFLYNGELLLVDEPRALKDHYPYTVLELQGTSVQVREAVVPQELGGIHDVYAFGNATHVVIEKGRAQIIEKHLSELAPDMAAAIVEPTFEDVFISLMKKSAGA